MYTKEEILFKLVVFGSCVIDYGMALFAMFRLRVDRRSEAGQIEVRQMFLSACAVTLAFIIKYAILKTIFNVDAFGLIHLLYVDMTVVLPLVGVTLLVVNQASRRRENASGRLLSRGVKTLAWLSLLGIIVFIYASYIEPFRLEVKRTELSLRQGRAGSAPLKIAVISDLQTRFVTDYEREVIRLVMEERPDLILLPGDVFQGDEEAFNGQAEALREVLAQLDAPGGVYLVPGDVDQRPGRLEAVVEGTKIKLLRNESVRADVRDRRLEIAGLELDYASQRAQGCVYRMEDWPDEGLVLGTEIRIILAHRPDAVSRLRENSRVDLVVAGHTHGGQIVVPGFGPLMTLSDVPRRVAAGGLHYLDGNAIYVSRGVGCERAQAPRMRFFCRPEISMITIK